MVVYYPANLYQNGYSISFDGILQKLHGIVLQSLFDYFCNTLIEHTFLSRISNRTHRIF